MEFGGNMKLKRMHVVRSQRDDGDHRTGKKSINHLEGQ